MSRYAIWNKEDDIYTPVGERLTAQQWISRYGWIAHPQAIPVVGGGLINGSFIGELGQMKEMAVREGCEFSEDMTSEEILQKIETFEDERNSAPVDTAPSAEERTAAALEFIAMSNLPDKTETA